jgi:hypothetical protein
MAGGVLASGSWKCRTFLEAETVCTTIENILVSLGETVHQNRFLAGQLQIDTKIVGLARCPAHELPEVIAVCDDIYVGPVKSGLLGHLKALIDRDNEREKNRLGHLITVLVSELDSSVWRNGIRQLPVLPMRGRA